MRQEIPNPNFYFPQVTNLINNNVYIGSNSFVSNYHSKLNLQLNLDASEDYATQYNKCRGQSNNTLNVVANLYLNYYNAMSKDDKNCENKFMYTFPFSKYGHDNDHLQKGSIIIYFSEK